MFLAAFIVSILLTAGSANAVDVMEWNSDSSPESPAKLSLETIVRRKHAAISVAGMIGGAEDSTDYYLVRRAFERPGVITVGIVSGNDVTPYNIEVHCLSSHILNSFLVYNLQEIFDICLMENTNAKFLLIQEYRR